MRARKREDLIVLEVQDYGPGIDPKQKMAMLQPGFREELQFGEVAGMGVGLELCKVLIEKHAGKIVVVTEKGKGSTFSAEIPMPAPA